MSMETIVGWVFGGFATKIYAAAGAVWIAYESASTFIGAMEPVTRVMG